jgi:indolepyruvate decarboxylase
MDRLAINQPPQPGVSIGQHLISRLQQYGVTDVFGIPGDYVLSFYTMLEESPLQAVGCTREDCAGFAADAYARIRGMGALCVTYCVGGLSVCNSIAGAFAEKSPVVLISGSPGLRERIHNPLLHHMVRNFRTQYDVFEKLCIAGAELDDPQTALREIDRVLAACDRFKRPVYLEIPRDMVHVVPESPGLPPVRLPGPDSRAIAEAVEEAARKIESARQPVLLLGVEVHRFGLQSLALQLAETTGIPIAATMLGKGVVAETHPLYMGLYEGALGREEVTSYVESSDCVVMLGTFMTDINLGIYTAELDIGNCIYATSEQLRIRHHHYHDVPLRDFLQGLVRRPGLRRTPPQSAPTEWRGRPYTLQPEQPIGVQRLMERLDQQLEDQTIVIADIGDSLFAATELTTHGQTEFISPAYRSTGRTRTDAAAAASRPPRSSLVVIQVLITSSVNTSPFQQELVVLPPARRAPRRASRGLRHLGQLLGRQVVDVLVERLARVDLVLDAVDHRHQHRREGQVRVAARVGAAELDALGLRARAVHRDADGAERLRCE